VDNGWWMVDWETGDRRQGSIYDFGFRNYDFGFLMGRGRWRGVSVFRCFGVSVREKGSGAWHRAFRFFVLFVSDFVLRI